MIKTLNYIKNRKNILQLMMDVAIIFIYILTL